MIWDNHETDDYDHDGLSTINEYRTSQWLSDPFTRDLFIELDQMCEGTTCNASRVPEGAKEMLYTAHDRQNVIYHLDDGSWDDSGSEYVPFDSLTSYYELQDLYYKYFLHGDENNTRKEIFHYALVIYESDRVEGMAFGSNRFQISAKLLDLKVEEHGYDRDVTYASALMHETGHSSSHVPHAMHSSAFILYAMLSLLYSIVQNNSFPGRHCVNIPFRIASRLYVEFFSQNPGCIRREECRQGRTEPDSLYPKRQQGKKHGNGFLLVPAYVERKRKVIDVFKPECIP